jgi:hypothetical protein
MAEFKLDRFKYNWKGDWTTGADYKRDDVVRVNGFSYVCIISHTGSALFATDLNAILPDSNPPQPQPKWVVMTASKSFVGDWTPGTSYNVGDTMLFGGTVWDCVTAHTASSFQSDVANWAVFTKHIKFDAAWTVGTEYGHGDIVKYGGNLWKCLTSHTAQGILENNQGDWEEFHVGQEYRNAWLPSTDYTLNDIVKYGGSLFKCIESHTSNSVELEDSKFSVFAFGTQFDGEWNSTTTYNIGDVVRYGGTSYYAITNNVDSDPSRILRGNSSGYDSTNDWLVLSKGYQFAGEWELRKEFKTGDITQRGGDLYVALTDVNINDGDESSLTYLDNTIWEKLVPGNRWKAPWGTGTYYSVGDVVYHLGTAYSCNYEHTADGENYPGDNGNVYDYWDILIQAGDEGGLHDKGDLLTFGLSRTGTGDGSTLGDTRVEIGKAENVLSITNEQEIFWRTFTADSDVIYVAPYGVNDNTILRGRSPELPFRTVRYACEFIEDNFAPLAPTKVAVATGNYDEIGPIIIPAGCVVMGDELRSTTITATGPIPEYAYNAVTDVGDYVHVKNYFIHISSFIFDLISNNPVVNTAGNTETPRTNIDPGTLEASNRIIELLDDFKNYTEFNIASGEVNPTLVGSNVLSDQAGFIETANHLRVNLKWIQEEIFAFLDLTYDNLNKVRIFDDVNSLVRGLARDIQYSGNYATLQAARRYANAVIGSQGDDMFYFRDTTGMRNLTTKGLTGTLNPPGVFDLYQRPTGGACTSLDPGWGPDDQRCWIMQRSPYIQGVTNIGDNCVGKKVDGSLHNGGNKSMTSNDFTQVLSDGIGAWISNGGRAELVSVFTYYCSVGYFAEDGGIIRATNGNNSYGSWGAIADGNDPSETPDTCSVWNRNNEAQVDEAFIGGATDEVKLFEYTHAGQHYTNATTTVVGAGAGVNTTFEDFRDLAVSQVRLINTTGSGSEGGSNYLVRQGFAQTTADASSTIKISNADETQFLSEIVGMRLIIISGPATGQYAYIDSYSVISKEVGVKRESDDQDGWDHVIPGTALAASFDSTTQYRIEPRVEVSSPSLSSSSWQLDNARTFNDVSEGGTSVTYQSIGLGLGSGAVEGIEQSGAVYQILRTGKVYTPSLVSGGAGYAAGDEIAIPGTALGGVTPDHDLTVKVLTVTDDSTNSILTAEYIGVGREPRIVACANPNYMAYSDNAGETWTENTHSVSGTLHTVIAGDNRFIGLGGQINQYVFSLTGESWTTRSLPGANNWMHGTYGGGKFVICTAAYANFLYSTDGLSWTETPHGGSVSAFAKVAYGQGTYISVSNEDRAVTTSSDGITWNRVNNKLPTEFATVNSIEFCGFAYGDNRFVGITESGKTCYTVDKGATWQLGGDVPQNGGGTLVFTGLKYGNGVWMASANDNGTGATNLVAVTQDGITWNQYNLDSSQAWGALTYTSNNNNPEFVLIGDQATGNAIVKARTGAKAILRADVNQGKISKFKIWNPGGGYITPPTVTITDNQYISEVEPQVRISSGVLAQPTFNNRGAGYRTGSTTITIAGDGYADIIEQGNKLTLAGVNVVPGPGVQIRIDGILDLLTEVPDDLKLYNGVKATDLGDDGTGNGTRLVEFQISPSIENTDNLQHGTVVNLRNRYSQCRVTGHDFLDIGTGGFADTNYPALYSDGNYFVSAPENEVYETNGGRVFYTSTDQDGNFRTGELFAVNQATGIVTISAQFFDLDGLSELSLGGVRLGGSGTSVQEFSTDPTMSADSNQVIPTQRAIATFLADRLSVGGEDLQTNLLQAGNVQLGGEDNKIDMNNNEILNFNRPVNFAGIGADGISPAGLGGTIISQMLLVRNINDTVQ